MFKAAPVIFLSLSLIGNIEGIKENNINQVNNVNKKTIKFLNKKATFKQHLKDIENQFNISIKIDKQSLQKHGISINQSIVIEEKEYTFSESLDLLTTKICIFNRQKVVFWSIDEVNNVMIFGK